MYSYQYFFYLGLIIGSPLFEKNTQTHSDGKIVWKLALMLIVFVMCFNNQMVDDKSENAEIRMIL